MASKQAEQAVAEAVAFFDNFVDAVDVGGPLPELDAALAALSPEAQVLAYERIIDAVSSSTMGPADKTIQIVGHLMRGGQGTLNELRDDLVSMSPEGRARALEILTSHPEYRVRGLRWRPSSRRPGASVLADAAGQTMPGGLLQGLGAISSSSPAEPGVAEPREYTAYQTLIDTVFALVDGAREGAVSKIYESMALAGAGDWTSAAQLVRSAIVTLNGLVADVSPLYKRDLAVAHFHLEAYLGQAGDNQGAEQAIRRSLELFTDCEKELPGGYAADVALASMSLAICLASEGNLDGAVSTAFDATETLAALSRSDFRAYGPALAEHLSNLANFNLHGGNVWAAASAIDRAVATFEDLISSNVPVAPQFVDLARNLQTAIHAAAGTTIPDGDEAGRRRASEPNSDAGDRWAEAKQRSEEEARERRAEAQRKQRAAAERVRSEAERLGQEARPQRDADADRERREEANRLEEQERAIPTQARRRLLKLGGLVATGTAVLAGIGTLVALDVKEGRGDLVPEPSELPVVAWNPFGHAGWRQDERPQTDLPNGLADITQVVAGGDHFLALSRDGTVTAWGGNAKGESDVPAGLTGVTQVAADRDTSLALKSDGTVVSWGEQAQELPRGLKGISQLDVGIALRRDGTVVPWGSNPCNDASRLIAPEGLKGVIQVGTNGRDFLALRRDGTVLAWEYYCPSGAPEASLEDPAELPSGGVQLAVGNGSAAVLSGDGTVEAWLLAPADFNDRVDLSADFDGVTQIAIFEDDASADYLIGLKPDGTLVVEGPEFKLPRGLTGVKQVAVGSEATVAVR